MITPQHLVCVWGPSPSQPWCHLLGDLSDPTSVAVPTLCPLTPWPCCGDTRCPGPRYCRTSRACRPSWGPPPCSAVMATFLGTPRTQPCIRSSPVSSIASPCSLSCTAPPYPSQLHSCPFVPPSLVPIIRPSPAPLPAPSPAPSLLSVPAEGRIRSPGPCRLAPAPPCALLSAPLRSGSARSPRRGRRPGMKVLRHKIELLTGTRAPGARRGRGSRCRIPRAGAELRGGSVPRCRSPRPYPRARGARGPGWAGEVGGLRGSFCGAAGASLRLPSGPAALLPASPVSLDPALGGLSRAGGVGGGPRCALWGFPAAPFLWFLPPPPSAARCSIRPEEPCQHPGVPRPCWAARGGQRGGPYGSPAFWSPRLNSSCGFIGMRSITVSSNAFPCRMLVLLQ